MPQSRGHADRVAAWAAAGDAAWAADWAAAGEADWADAGDAAWAADWAAAGDATETDKDFDMAPQYVSQADQIIFLEDKVRQLEEEVNRLAAQNEQSFIEGFMTYHMAPDSDTNIIQKIPYFWDKSMAKLISKRQV